MNHTVKKERTAVLMKDLSTCGLCFFLAFLVMYYPDKAEAGISSAISLCLRTVVPSLLPFVFISQLAVTTGVYIKLSKPFEKITKLLFRLPGEAACIIIMGMTGGFPAGTQMAYSVYEDGGITGSQARRLSLFAVNAGPAFVISTVGKGMLGSTAAGIRIYASLVLSCLIIGFLTRFLPDTREDSPVSARQTVYFSPSLPQALSAAAQKTPRIMVNICIWIILFGCFISICNAGESAFPALRTLTYFLEVTEGCRKGASVLPIPIIAGIIGWSGLSVHCQILTYNIRLHSDIKLFFTARLLCGALSSVICHAILTVFPLKEAVFSVGADKTAAAFSSGIPAAAGLLIMCALLLLGENFSFQR